MSLTIIIGAAGISKVTDYPAKCLIPLGDQTILEHQLDHISGVFGKVQIIVISGEKHALVKKVAKKATVLHDNGTHNILHSLYLGLAITRGDSVIVLPGDVVFNKLTLGLLDLSKSCILYDKKRNIRGSEVGLTIDAGKAAHFSYGLPVKWAQIVHLTGHELFLFKRIAANSRYHNCFTHEALNLILEKGGQFLAITNKEMLVVDIDSDRDLRKLRKFI